jgi:two-component system response regulator HydG
MMTSYADIQTAVKAMKLGASDYISKPVQPDLLLAKIHENLTNPVEAEEKQPEETGSYIEGKSQLARQMYEHVRLVAPTNMSVLIPMYFLGIFKPLCKNIKTINKLKNLLSCFCS